MKPTFKHHLLLMTSVLSICCLISCSNETIIGNLENKSATTSTELILENFNNSLPTVTETRGTPIHHWIGIGLADASGAYTGGKLGGKLGGFFGGVHGATVGAILGGTVMGGLASYVKYSEYKEAEANTRSISGNISSIQMNSFSAAYAANLNRLTELDYAIGKSYDLDRDAIKTGILHNKVLDQVEFIHNENNQESYIVNLNDIEKQVLNSKEMVDLYTKILNVDPTNILSTTDQADRIAILFINAVDKRVSSQSDLTSTINTYVDTVKESNELTQQEKQSLMCCFAVMAYSFDYWSKKMPEGI